MKFKNGMKVIDKITGKECKVLVWNQTHLMPRNVTVYICLLEDENGNTAIRDSRQIEPLEL